MPLDSLFLLLLVLVTGLLYRDVEHVAVHVDLDVVLVHARDVGAHGEAHVSLRRDPGGAVSTVPGKLRSRLQRRLVAGKSVTTERQDKC